MHQGENLPYACPKMTRGPTVLGGDYYRHSKDILLIINFGPQVRYQKSKTKSRSPNAKSEQNFGPTEISGR